MSQINMFFAAFMVIACASFFIIRYLSNQKISQHFSEWAAILGLTVFSLVIISSDSRALNAPVAEEQLVAQKVAVNAPLDAALEKSDSFSN